MLDDDVERLVDLLNEYGHEKFGDEWWPGNADAWIGAERAVELSSLLERVGRRPRGREGWPGRFGEAYRELDERGQQLFDSMIGSFDGSVDELFDTVRAIMTAGELEVVGA